MRKRAVVARTAAVKRAAPAPATLANGTLKLSVNVSEDVGTRLRHLAFEQRLSESSIVEVALTMLFTRGDGASLGNLLRQKGATLRRRRGA